MEELLKKDHSSVMDQLNAIQVLDSPISEIHLDLQKVLTKHLLGHGIIIILHPLFPIFHPFLLTHSLVLVYFND